MEGRGRESRVGSMRGREKERIREREASPGGAPRRPGASRRWPRGAPGSLHAGACLLEIEDKGDFSKNPLDFRVFSRIL
jgi:hypothetical protein